MIADLSLAWLFWLVIRWPILHGQINMRRMITQLTDVSTVRSRSWAIPRATFSAILMFSVVSTMARIAGMRFPQAQWAAIVIGVTLLVWRRELFS
jgi:hypothetical protein